MKLKAPANARFAGRQRGAVLVIGLIMLVVMTMLVISMLKTSVIELKIGGASHIEALNFSNAELAINNYISNNNGLFAPGFLNLPTGIQGAPNNTLPSVYDGGVYGGTVSVTTTQVDCETWYCNGCQLGSTDNLQAVQFDISATASGTLGGSTTVHTGVQTLGLSC